MIEAKTISKYDKYTTPQLRLKAGKVFRAWIRKRDEDQPCISCGSFNVTDAGHYYSAGHYPELEFNENNCHGQCRHCNMFLSGNLIEYRKGLIKRIGLVEVEKLDRITEQTRRTGYKHDRYFLIDILNRYK